MENGNGNGNRDGLGKGMEIQKPNIKKETNQREKKNIENYTLIRKQKDTYVDGMDQQRPQNKPNNIQKQMMIL